MMDFVKNGTILRHVLIALALPLTALGSDSAPHGAWIDEGLLRITHETQKPFLGLAVDPELLATHRVRCQIEVSAEIASPAELREWLASQIPGAQWEGHWRRWIQVTCPVESVPQLGLLPGARIVARPPAPIALDQIVTEGADLLEAPLYWSLGLRGEGVRIAIVDVGFTGYGELLGSELPARVKARSFFGSASGEGDITGGGQRHGTAVAEVAHDVAPEAEILLTNVSTPVELAKAVEWALDQGADVINHSVGWFFGPGDGTGEIPSIAQTALDEDVVWVNAAGNFADSHWEGPYRDSDGNHLLAFDEFGDESLDLGSARENPEVSFALTWNRWPFSTDLFFDVEIWNGDRLAASSEAEFGNYPYAFRVVSWEPTSGPVSMRVRHTGGDPSVQPGLRLEVFRVDGRNLPEHRVPEGSLIIPADVPDILAVGAIDWSTGELEPFSSWGPTSSGVRKPELVAVDAVSNMSYGTFRGTSAAAPHVTGAVALLQSAAPRGGMAQPRWSIRDTRTILQRAAEEPSFALEGAVAWGVVTLPLRPQDVEPKSAVLRLAPNPSLDGNVEIRLVPLREAERSADGWILELFDISGRRVWSKRVEGSALAGGVSLDGAGEWAAGTYWIQLRGAGLRWAERWVRLED